MRNLKKVLALVLALVMTMSLVTIANASDFADDDDITNKEAVEVLTSLGVIEGVGNNTFRPEGNVTRAQMAKMITIITLGDVDPSAFLGTTTDLKDINGHWAEAYIKYCYSQGVIAGKGNGKFDPNANVTSAEAAKMLLVAIGYNSTVQGYTGAQWAINVTRDAQISGFYDGVSVPSNQALTRDQAAQMIYNAVAANTIVKTPSLTIGTNEVSYTYTPTGAPLLSKTFSTKEYVGVMAGVTYASSNEKYTYTSGTNFKNKVDNTDTIPSFVTTADYTALRGEEVTSIIKTEKNGDQTVLGVYATGKSVVIDTTKSALEVDGAKLKVNGTSYELEGSVTTALAVANSYDAVKLVDSDANGKLDVAVVTAITAGKVTYVSDKEIIAAGATYKFADDEIPSGLAKDDYVSIYTKLNGVNVVTKLDAIEGKVTGDKASDNLIEVNGTWYNDNVAGGALVLGSTYKFYAVNGVVVANSATIVSGATISNLVMVLDADNTGSVLNAQARIMTASGEKKNVTIDKSGVTPVAGNLYMYEETSAGYKFSNPTHTSDGKYTWITGTSGDVDLTSGAAKLGTYSISDDAVVFVWTPADKDGAVVTGKQLKSLTVGAADGNVASQSKGFFHSTVSGLTRVSYAGVQLASGSDINDLGVTSGNTSYGYIVTNSYAVKLNNDTYTTYTLWTGSENVVVYEKGSVANRTKGTVVKYDTIGTDNIITGVSDYTLSGVAYGSASAGVAYIQGTEGKNLYLNGTTNAYELTSDTKYLYVDSNASSSDAIGMAGGEVVLADKHGAYYTDNVIAVTNASNEIVLLVVDVKNNMTTSVNKTFSVSNGDPTNFTLSVADGSNKVKQGDAIEITCKAADTATLSGVVDADGNAVTSRAMTAGQKITVFVVGNVTLS